MYKNQQTTDYFFSCVYDYLAIIDGDSTDSPALLVTCGAHYVGGGVTTQVSNKPKKTYCL